MMLKRNNKELTEQRASVLRDCSNVQYVYQTPNRVESRSEATRRGAQVTCKTRRWLFKQWETFLIMSSFFADRARRFNILSLLHVVTKQIVSLNEFQCFCSRWIEVMMFVTWISSVLIEVPFHKNKFLKDCRGSSVFVSSLRLPATGWWFFTDATASRFLRDCGHWRAGLRSQLLCLSIPKDQS